MIANPLFLFGLLGVAAPIIIHLIFRRQRTQMDFPTLMFLRRVEMKLASRRNLKEIVLLTLRALSILFIVLALARPGVSSSSGGNTAADAILIVDNSASMSLKSSMGTRLDASRVQAAAVLNTLGSEGRAAILTTVPSEATLQVESLSGDKQQLRAALEGIETTHGSGALVATIARAGELLEQSSSAPNREVYIFGDFQKNAFKDDAAFKSAISSLPSHTALFICPVVAAPPENNLAITAVAIDPRPKVAGRKVSLIARIKNTTPHESAATVSVGLRDQPPQQVNITLGANASQDVPLFLNLGQEGFASGEVKLSDDDSAYDNAWPFAIEVRGPIRVLVISPGTEKRAELDDSFYLRKALDPTGDGRLSGIRVMYSPQNSAPQKSLENFDAVVLCGVSALPQPTLSLLDNFVKQGGGLIVFPGRRDATLAMNHPLQAFLGGRITGEFQSDKEALGLRAVQPASPFFDDSRQPDGRVEFKEVSLLKILNVNPAKDTAVLAEYSDGKPALLLSNYGSGKVLWWTVAPNAEDSNLPLMPSFLALLHRSVSVLCHAESQTNERKAGQPLILDFSAAAAATKSPVPESVTLFDPSEKSYQVTLNGGRLNWRQTGRAGIYRMQTSASAKSSANAALQVPSGFAVVPDPDECDTEYLGGEEVKKLTGMSRAYVVTAGSDVPAQVTATREGRDLFGVLLMASLIMVLAEAMLANMLGTRSGRNEFLKSIAPSRREAASGLSIKPAEASSKTEPASIARNEGENP